MQEDGLLMMNLTRSSIDEADLAPDGSTYTVLLYGTSAGASIYNYRAAGYYQYRDDHNPGTIDYLHPSILTPQGEWIRDDETKGPLARLSYMTPCDVAFISPGKQSNGDGSVSYMPNSGSDQGALYGAGITRHNIGDYLIIKCDSLLMDRRCKLKFLVYKANNVPTVKINSLTIVGAGSNAPDATVKYFPATRQTVGVGDAVLNTADFTNNGIISSQPGSTTPVDPSTDRPYSGLPYVEQIETFYIGSGIYAPLAQTAQELSASSFDNINELDYLHVIVNINQGAREGVKQDLILNNTFPELSPQHEYVFHIVVESNYIAVYLDVFDADNNLWQATSGDLDTQVGVYPVKWSLKLGVWKMGETGNDWQDPQLGDQQIGVYE